MEFVPYAVLARIKRSVEVNLDVGRNGRQLLQHKEGGLEESEPVWWRQRGPVLRRETLFSHVVE